MSSDSRQMEPMRDSRATLVDLLDRTLDKGLVLYADIIVSVAGVPLIGVNLRAALAGMETMLSYGVMQDWDQRLRAWERDRRAGIVAGREAPLGEPADGRPERDKGIPAPAVLR